MENEKTKNKGELRDLEWTGWITKNLEELHLIQLSGSDELNNYFDLLNEALKVANANLKKEFNEMDLKTALEIERKINEKENEFFIN